VTAGAPLVSIIVPCCNGASWIADAIQSCLGQTWSNCEIIIVDNGSTDESLAVARRYESRNVIVLECPRPGASAARNLGLARASGEFIQLLDADDLLERDKIRIQLERLRLGPQSCLASGAWARFRRQPCAAAFRIEPVWRDLGPEEFLIASWQGGGMMPDFAWLTPRAVIDRAGPWNENLSVNDDGEYFTRVVLASCGILFCSEARGYYRTVANSLSGERSRRALVSAFEAVELSCAHLSQRHISREVAQACAAHYQHFIYATYPDAPDLVLAAEKRVAELGGSGFPLRGSAIFNLLSRGFGWKAAKHCQQKWGVFRDLIGRQFQSRVGDR
jgi:glycosyltransferase involved in cell wall biosynthesis